MALSCVCMSADVYVVCLQHALSTEKEEVMGLLIGEIDVDAKAKISAVVMLRRSDKRKDRVEISPEQLTAATIKAEELARTLGQPMRVLGWYHSHPHITVWPSHVDVQTQAMYQMMDQGFVGVIFSVFLEDKITKEQEVQVTCFQSQSRNMEGTPDHYMDRIEIPMRIIPTTCLSQPCLRSMVELPEILLQEEDEVYEATKRLPHLNQLAQLHNNAVYTKSLCHIAEVVQGPLLNALEQRHATNVKRCEELRSEMKHLTQALASLPPAAPHH
ncbi:lys-63-specific deubiquitinase BRCC36-like [Ischnura elegans]|uniref:lys-63-specific deubiquitinase BRCC36-like n=1 Tax=Ischnura elegans TaxID=197161 RepID=UPI001ED87053|nr:lys-63-specific deubiquitinase BRCC36-like [Ischnura elegans]